MATISFDVDDDVLSDFYEAAGAFPDATGASPDPSWSPEDQQLWKQTFFLIPFLSERIISVGNAARLSRIQAQVQEQVLAQQQVLQGKLQVAQAAREAALPASIRPAPGKGVDVISGPGPLVHGSSFIPKAN